MFVKTPSGMDVIREQKLARDGMAWVKGHEEAIRRTVIVALVYVLPAIWILQPVVVDPDVWWHLQTGKWIVEHGMLPPTDPFSVYGEGKAWIVYSWLFELSIYGLIHLLGESGIILYTLVLTWLIMLVLHRMIAARVSDFVAVCGLMTLSAIALTKVFTPRPWLLTILFFSITLEIVLSFREGKPSLYFRYLPLLYVLWANTHIQFIYGLGLLGLACVAPLLDHLAEPYTRSSPMMVWGSPRWKQLLRLTALCGFVTLINPYHVHLYSVVVTYAGQTGFGEYIQEMQAPPFRSLADWAMLGMFALALVWLGRRWSRSSFEVLLIVAAAFCGFRGQRDGWFLVLASLTTVLSQKPQEKERQWAAIPRLALVPISLLVVAGAMALLVWRDFSTARIQENTAKIYPLGAAEFVAQQRYPGPLYNHFNWGGYLLWRLPHLKVSMDGRGNVHGDERIKQSIKTWNGGSHWSEDLELEGAKVVIAQKDMALSSLLRLDPRFLETYQDETAVVFVRASRNEGRSTAPAADRPVLPSTAFDLASAP